MAVQAGAVGFVLDFVVVVVEGCGLGLKQYRVYRSL